MIRIFLPKEKLTRVNAVSCLNDIKKWCNSNKIEYEFCQDIHYYINAMSRHGFAIIPWMMDDIDPWVEFKTTEDAVAFKLAFL